MIRYLSSFFENIFFFFLIFRSFPAICLIKFAQTCCDLADFKLTTTQGHLARYSNFRPLRACDACLMHQNCYSQLPSQTQQSDQELIKTIQLTNDNFSLQVDNQTIWSLQTNVTQCFRIQNLYSRTEKNHTSESQYKK